MSVSRLGSTLATRTMPVVLLNSVFNSSIAWLASVSISKLYTDAIWIRRLVRQARYILIAAFSLRRLKREAIGILSLLRCTC